MMETQTTLAGQYILPLLGHVVVSFNEAISIVEGERASRIWPVPVDRLLALYKVSPAMPKGLFSLQVSTL